MDYSGLRHRDQFHLMLNLEDHPGFLPRARELAEGFLSAARGRMARPGLEPELLPFPYSREALAHRLHEVRAGLVEEVERYSEAQSWRSHTREEVVELLRHLAPFNQTDGCWLRNIASTGPLDEVRSLLFRIYVEELGGGDPTLHHGTVYTELLRGIGADLPDIRSSEYAQHPTLPDWAFTMPLLQLVVSQFTQDYLPEIIGMNLYLESSSVELQKMVLLLKHVGIDPHFFELHLATDDPATGHGALAQRVVDTYLDGVRVAAGDAAVDEHWSRVWTGYVAFATSLRADGTPRARPTLDEQVTRMIEVRAERAAQNHGTARLDGRMLNDLFADPAALKRALVASRLVVPGNSAVSPFFGLLSPNGPMYSVFMAEEIAILRQWVDSLPEEAGEPGAAVIDISRPATVARES